MRILLLNNSGYVSFEHVKFPVEVEATYVEETKYGYGGYNVGPSELARIGSTFYGDDDDDYLFFLEDEVEVI